MINDKSLSPGRVLENILRWLVAHPLLFVLLAHSVFSIGIWNARDGYGEETSSVIKALRTLEIRKIDPNPYINLLALTLKYLTPDPIAALTFIKYLSSLLATVALCLTLSRFSSFLSRSGVILACFVWIASSLNAPYLQSSTLSLLTFAVMLTGFNCLLRSESIPGLIGFYVFGIAAALMRPEYFLPVILVTLLASALLIRRSAKSIQGRRGWKPFWVYGIALAILATGSALILKNPPASLATKAIALDRYALFGLGQCYADFYRKNHPEDVFDPMTEYQAILDRTFKEPESFVSAIRNNPEEAFRYFFLNSASNLFRYLPTAMVDTYRDQTISGGKWFTGVVFGILIVGGVAVGLRIHRGRERLGDVYLRFRQGLSRPGSASRKLLLLLVLFATSSVSILLLVGTPRYFLPAVPLFYLLVGYGSDSLLIAMKTGRFEPWVVFGFGLLYCSPNFLAPRPNHEMDAVQHVAAFVKDRPRIAAWWADPDVILGLGGDAVAVNSSDGIRKEDIESGNIDILMVDDNLRGTRTWTSQGTFFKKFEKEPEQYGFKRLVDYPSGRFDVYYKPHLP